MSDLPQISEAEFEVMKIVWKHAPISTNEITDKLLQTTSWSPKTIQTLIKRLVNKGVLTYEKQSRVFVYTPVVKESEYIGQESNSFLERYYDGDITAMLSAYIENDRLSETEIDTLRSLLSKRSKKGGNYDTLFNMQCIYQRYHRNSFDSQADIQRQPIQPDAV